MIQVLNSLTVDYELQILLLEKRIGSKDNPFSIGKLMEKLKIQYGRLSTKQNSVKENVGTVAKLVIKQRDVSQKKVKMRKMMLFAIIVKRLVTGKKSV
jgi:hypothetical protein